MNLPIAANVGVLLAGVMLPAGAPAIDSTAGMWVTYLAADACAKFDTAFSAADVAAIKSSIVAVEQLPGIGEAASQAAYEKA